MPCHMHVYIVIDLTKCSLLRKVESMQRNYYVLYILMCINLKCDMNFLCFSLAPGTVELVDVKNQLTGLKTVSGMTFWKVSLG